MSGRYIAVPLHDLTMLNITHDIEYASGRSAEQRIELLGRAVVGDTVSDAARMAAANRARVQPVLVLDRQGGATVVYVSGMDGRVLALAELP